MIKFSKLANYSHEPSKTYSKPIDHYELVDVQIFDQQLPISDCGKSQSIIDTKRSC